MISGFFLMHGWGESGYKRLSQLGLDYAEEKKDNWSNFVCTRFGRICIELSDFGSALTVENWLLFKGDGFSVFFGF